MVWKCATPEGDDAAYSSAIFVDAGGAKQYVQLLQKGLVGARVGTGELLWRYPRAVSKYDANISTPLASGDLVYTASTGTGGGLVRIKPRHDGMEAQEVYFESKLPTAIGGAVKLGDYLYGTSQTLLCVEFASGKVKWEERAIGPASVCFADGRLYMHGENGQVALVEPSPDGYREKGQFTPPDQAQRTNQMEKPWAYPVVANGRLYLRDHGRLWSYDVRG